MRFIPIVFVALAAPIVSAAPASTDEAVPETTATPTATTTSTTATATTSTKPFEKEYFMSKAMAAVGWNTYAPQFKFSPIAYQSSGARGVRTDAAVLSTMFAGVAVAAAAAGAFAL